METLLPEQFAWMLQPFTSVATLCQPSTWPVSRMGMRWYKRRLASRVGEGAGIRMGARLSTVPDADVASLVTRATAITHNTGAPSPYIIVAGKRGGREPQASVTAPAGQWNTGRSKGVYTAVVLRRNVSPGDMLRAYVHAALISGAAPPAAPATPEQMRVAKEGDKRQNIVDEVPGEEQLGAPCLVTTQANCTGSSANGLRPGTKNVSNW